MTIRPTHRCFDDALDFFTEVLERSHVEQHHAEYTVVHAACADSRGELFAHAWVEHGELVWQGGILDGVRVFYAASKATAFPFEICNERRYSLSQALAENWQSGHYGPWVPALAQLCANGRAPEIVGETEPQDMFIWRPSTARVQVTP